MSIVSPNLKPTVHLICNAHLDPVWQWRWEEGASEALATFRNAADILKVHPKLIFCHNEAVLYQWVERYDPALFREIQRLVRAGRWAIAGGWFIQPDVNLPGTESLIRQIAEGRRYFGEKFGAHPRVAYNFDSFGHSGGLPQVLRLAGYDMYIHMRPQAPELALPADLYRWRGADGTVIPAYRIAVGLYHTERDNIEDRLRTGVQLALEIGRDVPVFWGLGNHGGGATRRDLAVIDRFMSSEKRVRILHSTPDAFFEAVRLSAAAAPIHDGDLQRVFTGCYTSLSRLKRGAVQSLGTLVQSEALASAAWWLRARPFPAGEFREAWRLHLFNDFHDIITGSCVEPAEKDALDQYGRAADIVRGLRLAAVSALAGARDKSPALPVTVANANPSMGRIPVEFECLTDYRPFWKGEWHLRLFRRDGRKVPCQEEQPEALLPFHGWRRRISFMDELPGVGVSMYEVKAFKGPAVTAQASRGCVPGIHALYACRGAQRVMPAGEAPSPLVHRIDPKTGLVVSLKPAGTGECLAGSLLEPLVIEDSADSWGTERWNYRKIVGRFRTEHPPRVVARGPIRTITQSTFIYNKSRIVMDRYAYPAWPVLDFRLRITWNEERRRLKLRIPTRFSGGSVLGEVPGAALSRPADGDEHVHGRWFMVEQAAGKSGAALGIVNSGQPGLDFLRGEVRLSVLRSSVYCHERGFDLDAPRRAASPSWKFSDIGVHDIRLLVAAGEPEKVKLMLPGLADYLAAPPAVYPHLPIGTKKILRLLSLTPSNIRLLACKASWNGGALVVRVQETVGKKTEARLIVSLPGQLKQAVNKATRGHEPAVHVPLSGVPEVKVPLSFEPFEIKTVRIEKSGVWREADMISEDIP